MNFLFNSAIVRNQIDAISRQIIGQANINTEELGNFKIPLPSLKEQKEIVIKLMRVIDEVNLLNKKQADTMSKAKEEIRCFLKK